VPRRLRASLDGGDGPVYVQDVLDAATGLGFSIGGLLFGVALFRARLLSRWASALFAYGAVSALALAALPDSFNRPFAVPTGVALIGLGLSLWRDQHDAPVEPPVAWSAQHLATR
jgi:hypothetical protein